MGDQAAHVGSCYQFTPDAVRFPGFERMTLNDLIAYSLKLPMVYHMHIGRSGRETWAKNGRALDERDLPEPFSKVLVGPRRAPK
jgi:hypothetical protein